MALSGRAEEGRTLMAVDLALQPAPALPKDGGAEVTAAIDLCAEQLQLMIQCLLEREADEFCQESLLLFAACKERRDNALRTRILEYDRRHGVQVSTLERESQEVAQALDREKQRQGERETLGVVHLTSRLQDLRARIKALTNGTESTD
jgi:hypothetical protein